MRIIESQPREDHQLSVQVEIEAEKFEQAKRQAARRISEHVRVSGFRPGKVPYNIIAAQVGEEIIEEEAIELLADEVYPAVLQELQLSPPAPGSLTNVEGQPPKLTFLIPLPPSVSLEGYRTIRLPYEWKEPTPEDVETVLETNRALKTSYQVVQGASEPGNMVLAQVKAKITEPEEKTLYEKEQQAFFIPSEDQPDTEGKEFFPGFVRQLIGLKAGETKTIVHQYPPEEADEQLRGKTVIFDVQVNAVMAPDSPEINDEMARQSGFENLEAMRNAIYANLREGSKAKYDEQYVMQVLDKIRAQAIIAYPPQLLEEEVSATLADVEERLQREGLNLELYLKSKNQEREQFIEETIRPLARTRLTRRLVLQELAKEEDLQVSPEQVHGYLQQFLNIYVQSQPNKTKLRRPPAQEINKMFYAAVEEAAVERAKQYLIALGKGETEETPTNDGSENSSPTVKTDSEQT